MAGNRQTLMLTAYNLALARTGKWQFLILVPVCCLLFCRLTWSQTSSRLTVTASVQSSIGLVFNNNANVGTNGYCPLTNAGTNNVGLDFGTASFTGGDSLACILFFTNGNTYIVTSGFNVVVSESNSTSASYNLAAKVNAAPPANVSWYINLTQLTTAFTNLQNNNNYGQAMTEFLSAQVNQSVAAGSLNQQIDFQATAN
jgi:hypothetical protein